MSKKMSRSDAIRSFLSKSKGFQSLAEIRVGIGAKKEEAKFVASTLIRLLAEKEVSRKERKTDGGGTKFIYAAKGAKATRAKKAKTNTRLAA